MFIVVNHIFYYSNYFNQVDGGLAQGILGDLQPSAGVIPQGLFTQAGMIGGHIMGGLFT